MFSGLMSRWMTPVAVGVVEGAGHLSGDGERFVEAQLLLAIELVPQRLAADQRQDVVEEAVGGAGVDQGQDVRDDGVPR